MKLTIDDVLPKLNGVKNKSGNQWVALCPSHNDTEQSLAVSQGYDTILLHCFAGCEFEQILRDLDLYQKSPKIKGYDSSKARRSRNIEETYDYTDENGKLSYQVIRFESKQFALRRPDNNGGWIWDSKGVKKTLYRLPDIVKAREDNDFIIFCEGGKRCRKRHRKT